MQTILSVHQRNEMWWRILSIEQEGVSLLHAEDDLCLNVG